MKRILQWAIQLGVVVLMGCGPGYVTPSTSTTTPTPTPVTTGPVIVPTSVSAKISTTTNFGDSITCAFGASSTATGYASLLDTAIGKPAVNLCHPGDEAADMVRLVVYPNAKPTLGSQQLYTVMIGTNDADVCGASSGCIANWYSALEAALTWLALPANDKQTAVSSLTQTGSWTPDLDFGLATTGGGNSLSFTVNQGIAGRMLYVAYRVFDSSASNPGTASLLIDGHNAATLSSAVLTGQTIHTLNGLPDTIFVTPVPLGAVGSHTVTITTTGASGAQFSLQWVGAASANYAGNPAAPRVVVGTVPSTSTPSLNLIVAAYNVQLATLLSALTADGMYITTAPTATALNISTDLSDQLHPNDGGHLKLAKAFAGVL